MRPAMSNAEIGPVASRIWNRGKMTTAMARVMALSEGTLAFRTYGNPGRMAASNARESPDDARRRMLRDRLPDLPAGDAARLHRPVRGAEPDAKLARDRGLDGRPGHRRRGDDVFGP